MISFEGSKHKATILAWAPLAAVLCCLLFQILLGGRTSGFFVGILLCALGFWVGNRRSDEQFSLAPLFRKRANVPAELLDIVDSRLVEPGRNLEQVRGIISDAAEQLTTSFMELSGLIQSQQESLRQMLQDMKGDSGDLRSDSVTVRSLANEMADTAEILGRFVRMVVGISKQSMDVYYCVEDISERLKGVSRLVGDVKSIAYQTTILALNAAIEAARAGEAGVCFQVVAGEVRALAERSKLVSEQITEQVQQASKAVESAQTFTERNASQDLSVLLTSKVRIDSLGSGIVSLDETLRGKLDSVSDISKQIAARTSLSVQGLQFEDIVRQILERSQKDLVGLQSMVRSVREKAESGVTSDSETTSDLAALAQTLIADQEANAQHKPAQETVTAGEVELF